MEIKISPSVASGEIKAPPSKSYAHRYLIASCLSGSGKISNVSFSNDILATYQCLKALGFNINKEGSVVNVKGQIDVEKEIILDCKESGSTLRFLIPICLLFDKKITLKGSKKLFSRGLDIYLDIFKEQNIEYTLNEDSLILKGKLKPGHFKFRGDVSSQFITGLLFVLPLLDGFSHIELTSKLESSSYVAITLHVLSKYGVLVEKLGRNFYISRNQQYKKDLEVEVEGDYSNSSFLEALNLLGGNVLIKGLNPKSKQGDKAYLKYFPLLKKTSPIIDLANCIDLGPILFTVAAMFNGATFKNINRLRIKESDRVIDMVKPLTLFGLNYRLCDNEIVINPIKDLKPINKTINPVNDHRVVMSLIILLTKVGGNISNIEAIDKSYPDFLKTLEELGIGVTYVSR